MKTCTKCHQNLPFSSYYKQAGMKDGYRNDCKTCFSAASKKRYVKEEAVARSEKWRKENPERFKETQRRHREANRGRIQQEHFAWRFGLSKDLAESWWSKRPQGCCLCQTIENLHFDHDHETGVPRGWLCGPHNMGIGLFKDSPVDLRTAATYLERGGCGP